jgi:Chaperone for protein-folding within the ER, fungal
MNYVKPLFVLAFMLSVAFAQNTITGKVVANNTQGFIIIGCLIDLSTQDCNYDKSQYIEVNQDEVGYYTDATGQPGLITPPTANINITLQVEATSTNPLSSTPNTDNSVGTVPATQPQTNNAIVGSWNMGSASSTSYYNSVTGEWAAPSGGGISYTFNPDGSYEYIVLVQSSLFSCTTSFFSYATGNYIVQDTVLALTPTQHKSKSEDNCSSSSNYEKDVPLETEYFFFKFGRDIFMDQDLGETLELTDLILNNQGELEVDPEDSEPLIMQKETQ